MENRISNQARRTKEGGDWISVEAKGHRLRVFSTVGTLADDPDTNPRHDEENISRIVVFGDALERMNLKPLERELVQSLADEDYYYEKEADFFKEHPDGKKFDLFLFIHDGEVGFSKDPFNLGAGEEPIGVTFVPTEEQEYRSVPDDELEKAVEQELEDYTDWLNRSTWRVEITDPDGKIVWQSHTVEVLDDQNNVQGPFVEFSAIEDAVENTAGKGVQPEWETVEDLLDKAWDEVERQIDEAKEERDGNGTKERTDDKRRRDHATV